MLALLLGVTACAASSVSRPRPRPPRRPPAPVTATLIQLANRDLTSGRWVSAMRRALDALAVNPDSADAYTVLGAAHWRGGDYAASTAAYRAALAREPANFGASVALGRNLQAAGDHEGAIAAVDRLGDDALRHRDPLQIRLDSQYALVDVDAAIITLDQTFRLIREDDILREPLLARAGFLRPLAGRGPLLATSGERGTSDLALHPTSGLRHSAGVVRTDTAAETTRVVFFELREEARVDRALADRLGLPRLGSFVPLGESVEVGVTIVPRLEFGGFTLHAVPALIDDLTGYDIDGHPGLFLGRQALRRIGAITFDGPRGALELSAAAPVHPPPGGAAAPLLLLNLYSFLAPVTTVSLDGSPHTFYSFLGGIYGCPFAVTARNYLKSGHLPRELADPDDPDRGLHMIYLDRARIGDLELGGGGGLVMLQPTSDETLTGMVRLSGFDIGGYVNIALVGHLAITYIFSRGEIHLRR